MIILTHASTENLPSIFVDFQYSHVLRFSAHKFLMSGEALFIYERCILETNHFKGLSLQQYWLRSFILFYFIIRLIQLLHYLMQYFISHFFS